MCCNNVTFVLLSQAKQQGSISNVEEMLTIDCSLNAILSKYAVGNILPKANANQPIHAPSAIKRPIVYNRCFP